MLRTRQVATELILSRCLTICGPICLCFPNVGPSWRSLPDCVGRRWDLFGPNWLDRTKVCRFRANFGHSGANSEESEPIWVFGRWRANSGGFRAILSIPDKWGQFWPSPRKVLSNLVAIGPTAKLWRAKLADFGRSCPAFWACVARDRLASAPLRSHSTLIRAK